MQNFIAQSMRRMGLGPKTKGADTTPPSRISHGTAPLAHMEVTDKWSYSTLQYPIDIQSRTDLGHYMMFYVNVPNTGRSKYARVGGAGTKKQKESGGGGAQFGAKDNDSLGTLSSEQKQLMGFTTVSEATGEVGKYDTKGNTWSPGQSNKVIDRRAHQGTASKALKQTDRTVRTSDAIVLYMPPAIMQQTASLWKDTELGGNITEGAARVKNTVDRAGEIGKTGAVLEALPGVLGQIKQAVGRGAAKALSAGMGGDALAGYDKISNRAMNNFLETTFTGVAFRQFSYTWKFTPKSVKELEEVHKIIKTFRFYMLPELPRDGDYGRYYVVPAEFDLFYMFRGDENTWLNKISTCVLKNLDLNYTPNGYQTFRPIDGRNGAPPVEIDMKLDFQETKILTKDDVVAGF